MENIIQLNGREQLLRLVAKAKQIAEDLRPLRPVAIDLLVKELDFFHYKYLLGDVESIHVMADIAGDILEITVPFSVFQNLRYN